MNRLHKKCVITSAGVHVLLAAILLFCPAFLTSKTKVNDAPIITIIPDIVTDEPVANQGGPPGSLPPAPNPAPPAPVVPPPPAPPPEPRREPIKVATPPKPEVEPLEVSKVPTRPKPVVDVTHLITRPTTKPTSNTPSTAEIQERKQREWQRQMVSQLDSTLRTIGSGTGSPVNVPEGHGSGSEGPSMGNYGSLVRLVYKSAWVTPEDATIEDATVEVRVTVASDGTVISKRITKRSGDAAVDASVQRALDRVTTIGRPFPEGAKDKERSFIIPFNMKTKRGTA